MALDTIIDNLRTVAGSMAGITRTYADPPESMSEFPAVIVFGSTGEMAAMSGAFDQHTHTIIVEVHESNTITPQAIDRAKAWPDLFFAALKADQTLAGAVSHIVWPLRYRMLPLLYGNDTHYGVRFEVTVREKI